VVIAANTAMPRIATGVYALTISPAAPGVVYRYTPVVVDGSDTISGGTRDEQLDTAGAALPSYNTLDEANTLAASLVDLDPAWATASRAPSRRRPRISSSPSSGRSWVSSGWPAC
jgi:hypothetical protein